MDYKTTINFSYFDQEFQNTTASPFINPLEKETDSSEPFEGRTFNTLEEAEACYKSFAKRVGFQVIIKTSRKHAHSNDYCSRFLTCRMAGKQTEDDDDEVKERIRRKDRVERTDCKARMFVVHRPGENKWVVTKYERTHNHPLVTPTKVGFMNMRQNITPTARSLISLLDESGVGPSKMMNVLSAQVGGIANVGFSERDLRNEVHQMRNVRNEDTSDAQAAVYYLKELKNQSRSNFFYRLRRDDDNRIEAIVWIDSRSRMAYERFGDAVTFDTTYRTNKYSMPFAIFTGVNHHFHSILFGFALMKNETEDTFEWVFRTWLEAMYDKAPRTIVTDQDRAMGNAIARVFPDSYHSLCSWHISQKYPEKLGEVYRKYPDTFQHDFDRCLNMSLTIEEFEERWKEMMNQYDLSDNDWLQSLYDVKDKWVPVFCKRFFSAGMTTTQRSESMNHFFDQYVNSSTSLKDFVMKSQIALEKQYHREAKADYETTYKSRILLCNSPLELHASQVYTKEMFRRVQAELQRVNQYILQKETEVPEQLITYSLYNAMANEDRRKKYVVAVEDGSIKCNCLMWDHLGVICRHILRYLVSSNHLQIPDFFILPRWTKNANRYEGVRYGITLGNGLSLEESPTMRYNHLCRVLQGLATQGSHSMEGLRYVEESAI